MSEPAWRIIPRKGEPEVAARQLLDLIGHPVTMSHGSMPVELRTRLGMTDNLVRFSVGIEDGEDLIADIDQELEKI